MPRYFFDIQDGQDLPDHVGNDLPDENAASDHAIIVAETFLRERMSTGSAAPWRVTIKDENGESIGMVKSAAI